MTEFPQNAARAHRARIRDVQSEHALAAGAGTADDDGAPAAIEEGVRDARAAIHEEAVRVFGQRQFVQVVEGRIGDESKELVAAACGEARVEAVQHAVIGADNHHRGTILIG